MPMYYITDLETRSILTDSHGRELWCNTQWSAKGIAQFHQQNTGHATGYVRAENPANADLPRQAVPWPI